MARSSSSSGSPSRRHARRHGPRRAAPDPRAALRAWLAVAVPDDETRDGLVLADGFDAAVIGIVSRFGIVPVVLYDYDAVIAQLVCDGLTEEEAVEHFEFNIIGAWVGDGTPAYAVLRRSTR